MRVYKREKLEKIICNNCKKEIIAKKEVIPEGVFTIDYKWGYFSKKDGQMDSFDLCEECYNAIISEFQIPVTKTNYTELI